MTSCKPGEIVLVRFPFTDLSSSKKRPALVVSPADFTGLLGDVVLLALTSRPQLDEPARLLDWKYAGLPKPTWVKPVLATLSSTVVIRRNGVIHAGDWQRAAHVIRSMIALSLSTTAS